MSNGIPYEQAFSKLEEIVERLEKGNLSLDESLKLFESGTKLSALCYTKLAKARQKVTEITTTSQEDK